MHAIEVITFDCYGTLIDWERGIIEAITSAAQAAGIQVEAVQVVEAFHQAEPEVQAQTYRPYRDVLAETAVRVADRLGWRLDASDASFLPESLPRWPRFDDTPDALRRLAEAGFRLGILSNVDDDLLAETRTQLPDVFDPALIVTAQQVRSYKPARGHFETARARIGDRSWWHVGQSHFHDVAPALAFGVPVVWVNRKREPLPRGGPAPNTEVSTLTELADLLVAQA